MGGASSQGATPTTGGGSVASPQAREEEGREEREMDGHIFMDKLRKYHENRGKVGERERVSGVPTVYSR